MTQALWSWPSAERALMAVLNVTPDSFYDGGVRGSTTEAVRDAVTMWESGARYLDVGGESSRPGASPVSEEEELRRVIPVIEALHEALPEAVISIDTVKPEVARRALRAGARVINDIQGLRSPEMREVAAELGAGVVLMHMKGTPETMQRGDLSSDDIITEVCRWLQGQVEVCVREGIKPEQIAVDPGVGFGKTVAQNIELIARLPALSALGFPVVLGVSRKSYLGALTGASVDERLPGTLASCVFAGVQGPQIWRVHDISEARQALTVLEALLAAQRQEER